MALKVSASEAAYLVNRHERIVRGRIKRGELPAAKERNSWRIAVDDLERIPGWRVDRGRLAQLEERESRNVESLTARLATVERELRELRGRLRLLEARPASEHGASTPDARSLPAGDGASASDGAMYPYTPPGGFLGHPGASEHVAGDGALDTLPAPRPVLTPTREGLPPGSVRAREFARAHGVSPNTLVSQMDAGRAPHLGIDTGASNGRQERWLTPDHQGAVIALWRRAGTRHTPCPDCPHSQL